jgi:hypothetical protein
VLSGFEILYDNITYKIADGWGRVVIQWKGLLWFIFTQDGRFYRITVICHYSHVLCNKNIREH